jgi:hypothetical protein
LVDKFATALFGTKNKLGTPGMLAAFVQQVTVRNNGLNSEGPPAAMSLVKRFHRMPLKDLLFQIKVAFMRPGEDKFKQAFLFLKVPAEPGNRVPVLLADQSGPWTVVDGFNRFHAFILQAGGVVGEHPARIRGSGNGLPVDFAPDPVAIEETAPALFRIAGKLQHFPIGGKPYPEMPPDGFLEGDFTEWAGGHGLANPVAMYQSSEAGDNSK